MKCTLQVFGFLILLFLLTPNSLTVSAQKRNLTRKTQKSSNQISKATDPRLTPPTPRQFNHSYEVRVDYDKFKNETMVLLNMPLSGEKETIYSSPSPLSISVNFSYKGQNLKAFPSKIFFTIKKNVWMSIRQAFPTPENPSQLIVLADNDRLKYSVFTRRELESIPFRNEYYYSDDFATFLPLKDFLRIANSNNVAMSVSYLDNLELNENHLEALRDFASRLNPNATSVKAENLEGLALLDNFLNSITKDKITADVERLPSFGTRDSESLWQTIQALLKQVSRMKTPLDLKIPANLKVFSDANNELSSLTTEALEIVPDKTLLKTLLTDCNELLTDLYTLRVNYAGVEDGFSNAGEAERILDRYKIAKFSREARLNELLRRAELATNLAFDIGREAKIIDQNKNESVLQPKGSDGLIASTSDGLAGKETQQSSAETLKISIGKWRLTSEAGGNKLIFDLAISQENNEYFCGLSEPNKPVEFKVQMRTFDNNFIFDFPVAVPIEGQKFYLKFSSSKIEPRKISGSITLSNRKGIEVSFPFEAMRLE